MNSIRAVYQRAKVIRDPIHGLIEISDEPIIRDLIDTPEFQRLRRIRQMGVGHLVYPGAVHTRFAHCLGTFHVASQILKSLQGRYRNHSDLSRILDLKGSYAQNVRIAALLHDLGHGPFSHVFERTLDIVKCHEDQTKDIIRNPDSTINKVLKSHGLCDSDINAIWQLIDSSEYPFLHDIISSQIDADRMDYLLRDSYSAGVSYGHFDQPWLLNSFCIGPEDKDSSLNLTSCRLCLDKNKGKHSAAQLIIARAHMSHQVYYHHATRCWEAHLICLFHEASRLAELNLLPQSTMPAVIELFRKKGKVSSSEFMLLDDACLEAHMNYWSQCGGENYKTLSSYSRAITQRRKCLRSKDLSKVKRDKVSILEEYLTNNVASAYSGWVIDTTDFRPYSVPSMKDFKEDPESYKDQLSKTAIFLSDGNLNTPCEPIQQCLPLLSGPISSSSPIYFLFYEDALEEKIQKAMRHCHIKI